MNFSSKYVARFMPTLFAFLSAASMACVAGGEFEDGSYLEDGESIDAAEQALTASDLPSSVRVHLVPQANVSGSQRVNFAVPLPPGKLTDPALVQVRRSGSQISSARRVLARYEDDSIRSLQIQVQISISGETDVDVSFGQPTSAGSLTLSTVESTLVTANAESGPRVWAVLPATWLSGSGVAGPLVPQAEVAGTALDTWSDLCDYATWGVSAFLQQKSSADVWLYDRGTAMYRGYAAQGSLVPLRSAYRETAIYRSGIGGTGSSTTIAVPGKSGDLKYYYAQNMAIHYLLTGDDRFREGAERIASAAAALWKSPGYAGGTDFWTERHAGFALLAYVWASIVSDDKAAQFAGLADQAVTAYTSMQDTYPTNYSDTSARCFAHSADAHGEDYGYFGCSPWMSAILADGLDAYARERGGAQGQQAGDAIIELGRMIARDGRDSTGRPFYWMGVGTTNDEVDPYNEHWGESAYVVAMAWFYEGKQTASLQQAANSLIAGLDAHGEVSKLRSFNWQCRSAVSTPYFMR